MIANLDGITILRYAHIYRSRTSGGAEQYLKQLNDGLLTRNKMTILQMHLVSSDADRSAMEVEIENRGQGQIIWIPVCLHNEERSVRSLPRRLRLLAHSPTPGTSKRTRPIFSTIRSLFGNSCGHLRYSAMILSEGLVQFVDEYNVDLVTLHWLSYDVGTLIANIVRRHIPYAIINHFDNGRLATVRTRRWVEKAAAIGGVSNRNVPRELQEKYVNLSDGVDINFFSPAKANALARPEGVVVFLPSRIVEGKGHVDLLLAARSLVKMGTNLWLIFAGAVESELLVDELEKKASLWNLRDRVLFLGQLTPQELRDWYAVSDMVVLPSSSEGLGRVLLEAQAMRKPVIAYESGGMPEAVVANKTGFLVRVGDHDALAERIDHLVINPDERLSMGERGREHIADNFSVPSLIGRHEQLYSDVLLGEPVGRPRR